MSEPTPALTPADIANGWTEEALEAYHAERDKAANLVPGNVVTEWDRPRPPIRIENTLSSKPHKYWRG